MKTTLLPLVLLFTTQLFATPCPSELERTAIIQNDYRESSVANLAHLYSNNFQIGAFYNGNGTDALFSVGMIKGLWASGFDPSGNLKVAASGYGVGSETDFSCGPWDEDAEGTTETCAFFTRAWKVTRAEVINMQQAFGAGSLDVMDIPVDILEWPAKGNPHITALEIAEDLAPFFDSDGDDIYNPMKGDYPIPLQESNHFVPHQFRFYIINDAAELHYESFGDRLKMEFHVMDFVVTTDEPSESEKAVFTRLKFINKGLEDLSNFKMGIWDDTDLGCSHDDYAGCAPELNSTYLYNSNGVEDTLVSCGAIGIPDNLSVVKSMIFADQSLKGFSYLLPPSGGPAMTVPSTLRYHNYMSGIFPGGSPLTVGGTGINPGSIDSTAFAFSDLPNESTGWSMQTVNFIGQDIRTISTFLDTLLTPGAGSSVDFIDYILIDSTRTGLEIFEIYEDKVEEVKEEFLAMKNGIFEEQNLSLTREALAAEQLSFNVYPNPSTSNIKVSFQKEVTGSLFIYALDGSKVLSQELDAEKLVRLDVSSNKGGIYTVTIVDERGGVTSSYFFKG